MKVANGTLTRLAGRCIVFAMITRLNKVHNNIEILPPLSGMGLASGEIKDCGANSRIGSSGIRGRRERFMKVFFAVRIMGLAVIVCSLPSGCASFAEVTDLKGIQDTAGFYPKALAYCGSDEVCHFFEQETPLADLTILSKSVRTIMVARQEVRLPEGAEFLRSSYTGQPDIRRQMMRIRITQRNPNRGWAEYARSD